MLSEVVYIKESDSENNLPSLILHENMKIFMKIYIYLYKRKHYKNELKQVFFLIRRYVQIIDFE